jgi:hypothetical protein
VPSSRPSPHWFYIVALAMIGLVFVVQRRRLRLEAGKVGH